MASKAESVLVFGATGNIGLPILNELALALEAGTFRRLAIFTSQNTVDSKSSLIKDLQSRGVEVFVGDIADKSTLQSVISNSAKPLNSGKDNTPFDTLVSAAGRAAILSQIPIIEIAEQTPSVKRYYPSEFGTDIEHPVTNDKEPPHQLKLKVRKYIREHVKRLDVTYLVVGPFPEFWFRMTKGTEYTGGFDVNNKKAILLGDGKGAVAFTSMPDVGRLLVASLQHPDASRNKALKVRSFKTTPLQVLAEFEKQTGGEKWQVEFTSREELVKKEKEAYESNPVGGVGHTLRKIWGDGGTLYEEWDNGRLGFEGKEETLEELVKSAVQEQKSKL